MTKIKKIIIAVSILTVIGILIGVSIYNNRRTEDVSGIPKNAFPVEIEPARTETVITEITAKGNVVLKEKNTVYPKSSGKIKTVFVKIGDIVEEGQPLIEYEDDSLDNLYDQLKSARLSLSSAELGLAAARLPASEADKMRAESTVNQAKKTINDIDDQINQLDISIDQLNRSIETAEKNYDNISKLYASGAISKNEMDTASENLTKLKEQMITTQAQRQGVLLSRVNAEESLDLANEQYNITVNKTNEASVKNQISMQQISVDQSKLQIELLEKQIANFNMKEVSPVAGTVVAVNALEGEYSNSARALADIAGTDTDNLIVRISVPESDAADIVTGLEAEITGNAIGKDKYKGEITKIYPIAEQKQMGNSIETVITMEVSILEEKTKLRSGNSVEASIVTRLSENTVVVPLMSTFSESGGLNYVYIMRDDYSVEKRRVELLAYTGMYVEVEDVLEGEKIILNPSAQIKEGVYVKPVVATMKSDR